MYKQKQNQIKSRFRTLEDLWKNYNIENLHQNLNMLRGKMYVHLLNRLRYSQMVGFLSFYFAENRSSKIINYRMYCRIYLWITKQNYILCIIVQDQHCNEGLRKVFFCLLCALIAEAMKLVRINKFNMCINRKYVRFKKSRFF